MGRVGRGDFLQRTAGWWEAVKALIENHPGEADMSCFEQGSI